MKQTPYRKAWIKFRKSQIFADLNKAMQEKKISQRYRANILQAAFAEGWNERTDYHFKTQTEE